MADVFISYASEDRARAKLLADCLEAAGLTTWWDRHLKAGDPFHKAILRQLDVARVVVVLWSEASVQSDWVYAEADRARIHRTLASVCLPGFDVADLPLPFSAIHTDQLVDIPDVVGIVAARIDGQTMRAAKGRTLADASCSILDDNISPLIGREARASPAALLLARHRLVQFNDSASYKKDLLDWSQEATPISARLYYGAGGTGKTRLAIEAVRELKELGWNAGFLPRDARRWEGGERTLLHLIEHGVFAAGLLIVVDYAEGRSEDVIWLARALVRRAEEARINKHEYPPARLVLISRSGGKWWHDIVTQNADLKKLVVTHGSINAIEVSQVKDYDRDTMFEGALESFRRAFADEGLPFDNSPVPNQFYARLKSEHAFERPLAVQMAALIRVAGGNVDEVRRDIPEMLDDLLGYEHRYWWQTLRLRDDETESKSAVERGVAQITLASGVSPKNQVLTLLRGDEFFGHRSPADLSWPIDCLQRLFSGPSDGLLGLEPDLVGEHHVAKCSDADLVKACLHWAGENRDRIRTVLTVLNRATRGEHGASSFAASEVLKGVVGETHDKLREELFEVAITTPGRLADILASYSTALLAGDDLDALRDWRDERGRTRLHFAVWHGQIGVVRLLLNRIPWLVNVPDFDGHTALFSIIRAPATDISDSVSVEREAQDTIVDLLIRSGAYIYAVSKSGETVLHRAAAVGNAGAARRIIECAREGVVDLVEFVNIRDARGQAALHRAAYSGHREIVALLLISGANPALTDSDGRTAVHAAAFASNSDALEAVLHFSSEQWSNNAKAAVIAMPDRFGKSVLHYSAGGRINSDIMVAAVVKYAAYLHVLNNEDGGTALHTASARGNVGAARILVDAGADINRRQRDGSTPMTLSIWFGNLDVVKLLLEKGADPNLEGRSGQTPLITVVRTLDPDFADRKSRDDREARLEIVRRLMQAGADLRATLRPDEYATEVLRLVIFEGPKIGDTAAHLAIRFGLDQLAFGLCEAPGSGHSRGPRGASLLHYAAKFARLNVARRLIELGFDVNEPDADGRTALHFAAYNNCEEAVECVRLLLRSGAEPICFDRTFSAPAHYAALRGRKASLRALLRAGPAARMSVDDNDCTPGMIWTARAKADKARKARLTPR